MTLSIAGLDGRPVSVADSTLAHFAADLEGALLRPDDPDGATALDRAADPDDGYATADAVIALEQMSGVLDDRAREVLRLRYSEDLLQREIAERVGCSQMHVSRILKEAVAALSAHATRQMCDA